ncbi:MAG: repressor LexA [Gemmatimonadetes bacterium]|nr:repressor LexA [Gemmatimonadota bacterium]
MPAVLTDLERRILDFMVQYLRTHTYQPSIREIGEQFEIKSTKTVSEHLGKLAEKGYVERDPSRSRGVRILGEDLSAQTVSVPCFASLPDPRVGFGSEGVEARYAVDRRLAGAKGCYYVRARGNEFQGVGVERGDFLLVEPTFPSAIRDGDLVVVVRDGGPELFRYSRNGQHHFLQPGRIEMNPVSAESLDHLQITGRVAGLYRRFEETPVAVSSTTH